MLRTLPLSQVRQEPREAVWPGGMPVSVSLLCACGWLQPVRGSLTHWLSQAIIHSGLSLRAVCFRNWNVNIIPGINEGTVIELWLVAKNS